jgi:hypothetical protein
VEKQCKLAEKEQGIRKQSVKVIEVGFFSLQVLIVLSGISDDPQNHKSLFT